MKTNLTTLLAIFAFAVGRVSHADELERLFQSPPASAKPGVLWMWMGGNVSSNGMTRDLEALHDAGFGGVTLFSLADVCTPWAGIISNSPTPEVVTFTEPWWKLVPASVTVKWNSLQLHGAQTVRDLWRQQDHGVFTNDFTAIVPAHGVELIRVHTKSQKCPLELTL